MLRMISKFCDTTLCLLALCVIASAQSNLTAKAGSQPTSNAPVVESDRSRDGLVGPVRRVRTEVAKLSNLDGKLSENKHVLVEVVAYDIKGNKVENQYFPIAGATLTGKEVYKYDEKGNISEMTMLNSDGSLLSRETYRYEYDFAGNWNKMTTSVAVVDSGRLTFEPNEVTYRSIMYYLDENMVKMVQPTANSTPPVTPVPTNTTAKAVTDSKTQPNTVAGAKQGDSKTEGPVLPAASATANKLSGTAPVEMKPANAEAVKPPVVDIGAEPPTPGPKPILKPVSGGVLNGTALSLPAPVYPDTAKRMRISGVVMVEVILDETGKVVAANATGGPTLLREAATQAAMKARFSPTKLSGQPVKVSGIINYKFALAP
ncbi:MAG TPA: TonB family protein [Pyrinomonadaceae bacterium]|nr:TonB family protein [Pyrinomonadaceae bacterium]